MTAALALLFMIDPMTIVGGNLPVSADCVCRVQRAIRWRAPVMPEATCAKIATALSATRTPRLLLAIVINESDLRPGVWVRVSDTVSDNGLGGVRCVQNDKGICTNGSVRGYTPAKLLDPVINIQLVDTILRQKNYDLRRYNGGTSEHGYEARIRALVYALSGSVAFTRSVRINKLVVQIVNALQEGPIQCGEPKV